MYSCETNATRFEMTQFNAHFNVKSKRSFVLLPLQLFGLLSAISRDIVLSHNRSHVCQRISPYTSEAEPPVKGPAVDTQPLTKSLRNGSWKMAPKYILLAVMLGLFFFWFFL